MKFKDILPFEEYVIQSKLSVEQINLRLKENIEPKRESMFSGFYRKATKLYEGELYGSGFKISRIISYRNSFLPVISGNFFTINGITNIAVKMEANTVLLVIWYLVLIMMGSIIFAFNNLFIGLNNKNNFPFGGKEFIVMLIILLITPLLAFKFESRKAKKFLSNLLEEIIVEMNKG